AKPRVRAPTPSRPFVRALLQRPALRIDHAEALPGGRLHYPPALDESDPPGAQSLQPLHFGFQVIRLDVEMHAAGMIDLLDQQQGLAVVAGQLAVGPGDLRRTLQRSDRAAQRGAPES